MKTEEVAETDLSSKIAKSIKGNAIGVGGAQQATNARSDDSGDWNLRFFEDFKNAQMGESS